MRGPSSASDDLGKGPCTVSGLAKGLPVVSVGPEMGLSLDGLVMG